MVLSVVTYTVFPTGFSTDCGKRTYTLPISPSGILRWERAGVSNRSEHVSRWLRNLSLAHNVRTEWLVLLKLYLFVFIYLRVSYRSRKNKIAQICGLGMTIA